MGTVLEILGGVKELARDLRDSTEEIERINTMEMEASSEM